MSTNQSQSPNISLTDFIDFVAASGSPKLTVVKRVKDRGDYDPRVDFWRKLREEIIDYHRTGQTNRAVLDAALSGLTDKKKITAYPSQVSAYKTFLGRKSITWFAPPAQHWSYGGLTVRTNPELGLVINGSRHLVKLYFKQPQLSRLKVELILTLMSHVLTPRVQQRSAIAVLDVPHSNLIASPGANSALMPLLQGEATNFATIWRQL